MKAPIHLDHHTNTFPFPPLLKRLEEISQEQWYSLAAPHPLAQNLFPQVNKSLAEIYTTLGAEEKDQFLFTSSGAHAINQVLLSTYFDTIRETGRTHVLTTQIEEAPTLLSLKRLEKLGCNGKMLPVNHFGQLTKETLEEALRPRSALVSLSWANSLTGVLHPLEEISSLCREKEVLLHVDASYVIGKLFFRFQDLNVDFLTFDGKILHAPQGTGGILARKELSPLIVGEATPNVPALITLGEAIQTTFASFDHVCTETARLRDKLEKEVQAGFPEAILYFQEAERLPNTATIIFPGVLGEALLYLLSSKGVYATLGGGHSQKLSSVLEACGCNQVHSQCALSFSLSYATTEEEIEKAVEIIVTSARKLRAYSSHILGVQHANE